MADGEALVQEKRRAPDPAGGEGLVQERRRAVDPAAGGRAFVERRRASDLSVAEDPVRASLSFGRYLMLVPVVSTFAASVVSFIWGMFRMFQHLGTMVGGMLHPGGESGLASVRLIEVLDGFLLSTILYIFSVGMYELFIGKLNLPRWLITRSLNDLKEKLVSVIVIVMGVNFLEHLVHWEHAQDMLMFGGAIALVSIALLSFTFLAAREEQEREKRETQNHENR